MLQYYDHFIIPFTIGTIMLFCVLGYKFVRWFYKMPSETKTLVWRNIFTTKTLGAMGEVVSESLLHRKIFRTNPVLGYMHASLAFGWFLLIVLGWVEASLHLSGDFVPLHAHIFYKFFTPQIISDASSKVFGFVMDLLLLIVLSGVLLAYSKRIYSRMMGMKRTTKHVLGDRIALMFLWLIFPLRLMAESVTSGIRGNDTFLTGSLGSLMLDNWGITALMNLEPVFWWAYSIALCGFFVSLPFSRYMHIFTEIPLIFLRRYGAKSEEKAAGFDQFQIEACSRCGICIDPCQLQSDIDIRNVQSVYFLRDRRYHMLERPVEDNCLMCGRCETACPVGIELNMLRLNSRSKHYGAINDKRFAYLKGIPAIANETSAKVGYFAGCMTLLTPRIIKSMETIFAASGNDVMWIDKEGGVCCGRPLKLSGEVDAAKRMVDHNRSLILKNGLTTIVTSCPICLKVFKEDYELDGLEILHHSEYINRLIAMGKLQLKKTDITFTYHDPCELGRGSGIYEAPREVIKIVGVLTEAANHHAKALCCGSSLANISIEESQQKTIAKGLAAELMATGADGIVTSCPLCKKAVISGGGKNVMDLCEVVAAAIVT